MARLNELPLAPDSLDTLRRRFLRQNRDIARINSNQSLRIRGLENECARLLSENLDLRGQVLRLEKEVDELGSQRVSDQTLRIKEQMEDHLVELGSLLASFGVEPPTKRYSLQSPVARRRQTRPPRPSIQLQKKSPPQQLSPRAAESLAAQEGRLAPIFEDQSYPRRTLDHQEILSTQADAAEDEANSPELRPPTVSRLFQDSTRGSGSLSPSKSVQKESAPLTDTTNHRPAETKTSAPETKKTALAKETPRESKTEPPETLTDKKQPAQGKDGKEEKTVPSGSPEKPLVVSASSKSGSKRKFAVNDENAAVRGIKAGMQNKATAAQLALSKGQSENVLPIRELKNPKSIRDLAGSRKGQNNQPHGDKGAARKPLSAKSTNEDVFTPRKREHSDAEASKNPGNKPAANSRFRDRKISVMQDSDAQPQPPATVDIRVEDTEERGTPTPRAAAASHQPEQSASLSSVLAESRDTPPPADISLQGEMARPSRRARASVSYAEPNLRVKMRRPTKELFDAVAGEGRYRQRQPSSDGLAGDAEGTRQSLSAVTPSSMSSSSSNDSQTQSPTRAMTKPDLALVATAEKGEKGAEEEKREPAKISMAMEKRKRVSAAAPLIAASSDKPDAASAVDPYDFALSASSSSTQSRSSNASTSSREAEDAASVGSGPSRRQPAAGSSGVRVYAKMTRRASAAARDDAASSSSSSSASSSASSTSATSSADKHTRPSGSRKRVSMVVPKKTSMLGDHEESEEDDPADSSYEPPVGSGEGEVSGTEGRAMSTRDRISRRRSMML